MRSDCIFCQIAVGKSPAHIVWEDKQHIAFLSIYPNTDGFTVVINKKHYPGYFVDIDDKVFTDLFLAAKKVAQKIDTAFADVGRTGLIAEGMMINHLHFKLFPMHGTKSNTWEPMTSSVNKFFEKYEGYISSHNYKRENDKKLAQIAEKIKKAK